RALRRPLPRPSPFPLANLPFLVSRHVDDLDLGEAEQAPRPILHADARPLGAAERQVRGDREVLIHPGGAALEAPGHVGRTVWIARPHRSAETEVGRVRSLDRLVDILICDHRQGRAELFFVDQAGAVGDLADDRRRIEIAFVAETMSAGLDAGALSLGVLDELDHALELRLV